MDLTTEVPFLSLNYDSSGVEDAISSTTSSETDVATETTSVSAETFLGQVPEKTVGGKTVDGFLVSASYSTSIPSHRVIFPSDPILKGSSSSTETSSAASAWPRVKSTERNFVVPVVPSWFRALKQKYESKRQQKARVEFGYYELEIVRVEKCKILALNWALCRLSLGVLSLEWL